MISEAILASLRTGIAAITQAKHWYVYRVLLTPFREALQQDPVSAHAVIACIIRPDYAEEDYANLLRNEVAIDCIRMVLPRYAKKAPKGPGSRNTTPEQDAQLEHDYYHGIDDLVNVTPEPRCWREIVWHLGLHQHPMSGHGAIFKWAAKSPDALGGAMRYAPPVLSGARDVRRKALDAAYAADPGYATACAVTDDPLELYALMQSREANCSASYTDLPDITP